MSEWISVKQELPPIGMRILGCKGPDHIEGMKLVDSDLEDSPPFFIYLSDGDGPVENVTHWVPLLAPPTTE